MYHTPIPVVLEQVYIVFYNFLIEGLFFRYFSNFPFFGGFFSSKLKKFVYIFSLFSKLSFFARLFFIYFFKTKEI